MQSLMDPDVCNKAAFLMTAEMFALCLGEAVKSIFHVFSIQNEDKCKDGMSKEF